MWKKSKREKQVSEHTKQSRRDLQFIYDTQPKGGVSTAHEFFIRMGDSYNTCVHVIDRPTIFTDTWIKQLVSPNTTLIADYYTPEYKNYKKEISDSISEISSQKKRAQTMTEFDELDTEEQISRQWSLALSQTGEQIKQVHLRIFVYDATEEGLERRVNDILQTIGSEGYTGTVFMDENDDEYRSMFLPIDEQERLSNARESLPLPGEVMGLGFSHNQTALNDRRGRYYGTTFTGGTVYIDFFEKTGKRTYYNAFLSGDMGAGKSTTLKAMLFDRAMRGDLIRIFGTTKEANSLVRTFNGTVVNLDGTDGMINMYQIFPTAIREDGTVDERSSFQQHISKAGIKYRMIDKEAGSDTIKLYTNTLHDFYESLGFTGENQKGPITGLPVEEYPVLSDVITYFEQRKEQEREPDYKTLYSSILLSLTQLRKQYGNMFNGPTTFKDLGNVQVVCYNTNTLLQLSEDIQDLQMYNAIDQTNEACMRQGMKEFDLYNERIKTMDSEEALDLARHFVIAVDECHNWINTTKSYVTKFFMTMMSEARKLFGGIWLATQRLERMFPKMDQISDKEMAKAANDISQLYGLCQYRFLLKHSKVSLAIIRQLFGDSITETQYDLIPQFERGQGLLCIDGAENLLMSIEVTKEELNIFGGGA
ncbi:TPA: type IV secretion system protein VirB4 [Enterococcus faecalis]|nr:type IV secretion system protein VirB4 [Enterococcus faecalis]